MKHHFANLSVFILSGLLLIGTLGFSDRAKASSNPLISEIIMFGSNFAPRGWAFCDGQLLPIAQHTALFSLLGTTYGGDGRTTFGLPDLRGRVPMHEGQGYGLSDRPLGQKSGLETNSLTENQMPNHTHTATTTSTLMASTASGNNNTPTAKVLANDGSDRIYRDVAPDVSMSAAAISSSTTIATTGGGQPVNNLQPYTVVNFIIALQGIFPSRN